jgi:uracil-DNA glycosylase
MKYKFIFDEIDSTWRPFFTSQRKSLRKIEKILNNQVEEGKMIYPKPEDVFKVFTKDFYDIKVLILGQDPYINPNQAMGLSFSVPKTERIPPSLQNIFKQLNIEYPNQYQFTHGDLSEWFKRENIFLLNAALTVEAGKSGTHMDMWEKFTDKVIEYIAKYNDNVVYILLGNYAKSKIKLIPSEKHKNIITCVHPSPFSANNGFFKSGIFVKTNTLLTERCQSPICWQN